MSPFPWPNNATKKTPFFSGWVYIKYKFPLKFAFSKDAKISENSQMFYFSTEDLLSLSSTHKFEKPVQFSFLFFQMHFNSFCKRIKTIRTLIVKYTRWEYFFFKSMCFINIKGKQRNILWDFFSEKWARKYFSYLDCAFRI